MTDSIKYAGNLQGYSVLVTGGGTGIGAGCAIELVADGAAVTICGRRREVLDEAAEKIAAAADFGGSVQVVTGDVTSEEGVAEIVAASLKPTGRLDGCIANAGGGGMLFGYENMDTEEFIRVMNLNVLGTMLCVKHTLPHLVESGRGSFVGMSSLAGHVTHPWFGAYPVSKAGIEAMMRNCADENGPQNVRFNAIRPGFVATEDIGRLARLLVSQESRWITGQCINVDGGQCLRRGPDFSSFKG
jgi:NAD(P)-dependent dehydrogenase (short-subunit alcohol dehydrogenase family)